MADALTVLKERRSCRSFDGRPVEEDKLNKILEAGMYAPTGMGRQSPVMVAVTDSDTVAELSKMNAEIMGTDGDPFYGASTVIIVLADKNIGTHVYDGALVMGNLMNAAEALGVQSCWIHRAKEEFDSPKGKAMLKKWGIEGDYEGIGHCVLGYGEKVPAKPRKENYIYRV
ncbi:MAG TPA: nitroreductase [Candidatus Ornithomonoglobus intestinigallinarum]|uniref:Nitroreductase n=1 Tax=Candidatus Ornithomonoglobus intestinigallinarum TaxID=2840894 RepID=A0A9D1H1T6_9FIRM|nr:nitroreductase [Candidatus Ornithomonoglobus intestinigallinarum]